ncbi:MAG TPA: protocatechuate 3,4-dioxygenase subunit alpha [Casimicrobiaceae bacterium]|jgi:protocatechuate 3,4-dioxygenase alpha subunit
MHTTSSQTIGPYLHIGMTWLACDDMAAEGVAGERVTIQGRVIDADGAPVNDAMIEIWQANAQGKYAHPEDTRDLPVDARFTGFGRVFTGAEGRFRVHTIKPGPVPGPDGGAQAPHLNVTIFMRGLLKHLITRMYFPDDANAHDAVLQRVPAERRATLVARAVQPGALEWNIVLQGDGETVFFDC